MTTPHVGRITGVSAAALVAMSSGPALAQSNAELMDIIRQQQRQIEELSQRVDELQGQTQQATEKADTAAETAQKVEEEAPDIKVKWGPGRPSRARMTAGPCTCAAA
jgi:methyl-accepting chemotaxis protein